MRQTPPLIAFGFPTLLCLPLVFAAPGCAATPWGCTSDTCVTIASADLPEGIHGTWRGVDGSKLRIHPIYLGGIDEYREQSNEQEVFPRAATMTWSPKPILGTNAHLTSFDGRTAVAERRMGSSENAPRRFLRLRVEANNLVVAELRLSALVYGTDRTDVEIVTTAAGEAVIYDDVRAMATTIEGLLTDPGVWEGETHYVRDSN